MKIEYCLNEADFRAFLFYSLNSGNQKERNKKIVLRMVIYFMILIAISAIISGTFPTETFIILTFILVGYVLLTLSRWFVKNRINRAVAEQYNIKEVEENK